MGADELQPDGYWLIETPVSGSVRMFRRMHVAPDECADASEVERMTADYLEDVVAHPERHLNSGGSALAIIERVPVESAAVAVFMADAGGCWIPVDTALAGGRGPLPLADLEVPNEFVWAEIGMRHVENVDPRAPLGPLTSIGQVVESVDQALRIAEDARRSAVEDAVRVAADVDHLDSEDWMIPPPVVMCVVTHVRHGEREFVIVPPVVEGPAL